MQDRTDTARSSDVERTKARSATALELSFAAGMNGSRRAYEAALTEIAGLVRRLARRHIARGQLHGAEIEDVVQEILLAVHDKRHTWDDRRPLEPWLAGTVRYKLLDARRARARDRLASAALLDDLAEILPAQAEPEGLKSSDILDWLPLLPARERGVVAGLVFDGASPQTLAQRMEITENAVHAAWSRAVARLALRFGRARRHP